MRKLSISALIVTILFCGLSGCKKIIRNLFEGIDADVPKFSVTLPAIPYAPPNEVSLGSLSQKFNLDSAVRANTNNVYGANDVSSVKVKEIVFSLANPDDQNNISNFESARFTFSSNTKTDTVTIASVKFPDTYSATYTYVPDNNPELKPYLNGSVLTYNAFGKIRRVTTKPVTMNLQVTLRVQ
ncbi:hypothetical protein [Segetibacter koreensis]|uniref:hypothetical protein n=1 Tax=Segetibacter koreensis TaxID=398037 RepID=UPI000374744C|nr:hypothetical protein [Segetibacter koreensis]